MKLELVYDRTHQKASVCTYVSIVEGKNHDTGRSFRQVHLGLVRRVLRRTVARRPVRPGGAASFLRLLATGAQRQISSLSRPAPACVEGNEMAEPAVNRDIAPSPGLATTWDAAAAGSVPLPDEGNPEGLASLNVLESCNPRGRRFDPGRSERIIAATHAASDNDNVIPRPCRTTGLQGSLISHS